MPGSFACSADLGFRAATMRKGPGRIHLLAAALAVTLAACGGDDDGDSGGDAATPTPSATSEQDRATDEITRQRLGSLVRVENLLRHIPSSTYLVRAMDWQRAREELRIDEGTDPADYRRRDITSPEADFDSAALTTAGYLTGVGGTPAAKAIDHGQVTAAVSATSTGGSLEPLILLATDEPRADLEAGLDRAGYRDAGDGVFARRRSRSNAYPAVGLGEQLIVLGDTSDAVTGALGRTRPGPELETLIGLLDGVEGANRTARSYEEVTLDPTCVRGVAGSQEFRDRPDGFVIHVSGRAAAGRVRLGRRRPRDPIRAQLARPYRTSGIEADGSVVRMAVSTPPDAISIQNAARVADTLQPEDLYSCPGRRRSGRRRG
jgi:hypothetical protein